MPKTQLNKIHNLLSEIADELRDGDRITIWKGGYQIHMDKVGTSNFSVKPKVNEKNTNENTIQT